MLFHCRFPLVVGLLSALILGGRAVGAPIPAPVDETARRAEIQQNLTELTAKLEKFGESLRARQPERAEAIVQRLHPLKEVNAAARFGSLQRLINSSPELDNHGDRAAIVKQARKLSAMLSASLLQKQKDLRIQLEGLIERQKGVRAEIVKLTSAWETKPEITDEQKQMLAALHQQQSTIAGGIAETGDRLASILVELRHIEGNFSPNKPLTQRIEPSITLLWIVGGDASDVATYVQFLGDKELKSEQRQEMGQDVEIQQLAMTAALQKLQTDMVTWEGFQEAVLALEEIVREQDEALAQPKRPAD